jgi:hypothetical protein
VPKAGGTLPAARLAAGGNVVGIPPVSASEEAGTGEAMPAIGREAADIGDGTHPVGGKGVAGHCEETFPNSGSFM